MCKYKVGQELRLNSGAKVRIIHIDRSYHGNTSRILIETIEGEHVHASTWVSTAWLTRATSPDTVIETNS